MADCLKSNLSVQEPVYCVDSATEEVVPNTAMYSWMAVRAAGPNVLQDTTLCGDTIQLGFQNSNKTEGIQPQLNEAGYTLTSDKLIWDYNPPVFDNLDMPSALQPPTPLLRSLNPNSSPYTQVYMSIEPAPGPITLSGPGGDSVQGDNFLEVEFRCRGSFFFTEVVPANNPVPGLYQMAGPLILQTNLNKYGNYDFFSALANVVVTGSNAVAVGANTPFDLKLYAAQTLMGVNLDPNSATPIDPPERNPYVGSLYINPLQVTTVTDLSALNDGVFLDITGSIELIGKDTNDPNPYIASTPPNPPPP